MKEELNVIDNVNAAGTEEQAGAQSSETIETPAQEKKYTDADVDKIIARKIAAERKKMSKLFNEEQQESEIEKRERNVLIRELKADAKDLLIAEGLPSSLASILAYETKEDFDASYKEVTKIFKEAVQREIKARLRGETPRKGYGVSGDEAIRDAFAPKAR